MKTNKKKLVKEQELDQEDLLQDLTFERHELTRVYAVGLEFSNVSFKQSIVESLFISPSIFQNKVSL